MILLFNGYLLYLTRIKYCINLDIRNTSLKGAMVDH
jgi:hypothetical protein